VSAQTQSTQQKNYQPFFLLISIVLGIAGVVPAFLGIQFWQNYQEGIFPPLRMVLHRREIVKVVVENGRIRRELTDPGQIDQFYQALIAAGNPVGNRIAGAGTEDPQERILFFRQEQPVFPVEVVGVFHDAFYCPTLERSYIIDSGGLMSLLLGVKDDR